MTKAAKTLDELFHDTLKDIFYAEKKILAALPKMAKAAQNPDLKAAFEKHETETEEQVSRLEQVFGILEKKPQGKNVRLSTALSRKARRSPKNTKVLRLSIPGSWPPLRRWSTMKSPATAPCGPGPRSLG